MIILLGAVAARHVVGINEGIMKLRGRWLEYRVGDRMVPLMRPCIPPICCASRPTRNSPWRDLQAVAARMKSLGLPEL